ncbi:PDDEXK-like family protein [Halomonas sp. 328]|uniref:PDDEXK-like family protein n=1 Tax=Halomonas sp. 328 TaxID=2776704 RepID=UPI0018A79DC4|nr:PD-(D/E)XK nuclease family protein [Halomonas sp. 328]MBF8223645.1 PD-(D/E)XK nuclease family protein [Halomonas sp. 328]
MTSHHSLLHLASLLRQRHARPPGFNLFTTLRGGNDEVRLHSRFLAALLNPRAHGLGAAPLNELLERCAIRDFALEGVRVECERWNIDILVTNARRQALLIENKIHADDQPEQLVRYHRRLREAGYREIHVRYLTLEGRDPREDSLGELRDLEAGSYGALGYYADLVPWLEFCLGRAALDPPLRESLAQYRQLILQLTGHDMDNAHLETLAETLLQGDNLLGAHDIRLAYDEALARLQARLWRALKARIAAQYPAMADCLSDDSWSEAALDGLCRDYVQRRQNSKGYGLYYHIPGYGEAICAGFEIEYAIYLGIYCEEESEPERYRALCKRLDAAGHGGSRNAYWPSFAFPPESPNLRTPSAEQLAQLSDPDRFADLVATMSDELARLWEVCRIK